MGIGRGDNRCRLASGLFDALGLLELVDRLLSARRDGAEDGERGARILLGGRESACEPGEDTLKRRGRRLPPAGLERALERSARRLAELGALRAVRGREETREASGIAQREASLGERERSGDLLVLGKPGELLDEMDTEELPRQDLAHSGVEPAVDLEASSDPLRSAAQSACNRSGAERVLACEPTQRLELFGEGGASSGVIESEPGEERLGS